MAKNETANASVDTADKAAARAAEKSERFRSVAGRRTGEALESIDSLIGCTNKSNYAWTDDQAAKIVKALREKIGDLESAFKGGKASGFTL